MAKPEPGALQLACPLRTAARRTGLSPERLRARERRHGVVEPRRTPGGTRRYSAADVERLRLVKAAVDAGPRIGEVARMKPAELKRSAGGAESRSVGSLDEILVALDHLEGGETRRLLSLRLSALGPACFAREVALPLVREIGSRWGNRQMGIAPEHLATGALRSLLGSALQPTPALATSTGREASSSSRASRISSSGSCCSL